MKKNPKKISENKKYNYSDLVNIDSEINNIITEIIDNNDNNSFSNDSLDTPKININNKSIKFLHWYRNSCAFDSFLAAFVFSIYPLITKNDIT